MNQYTRIAKEAVENYIKDNIVIIPPKDLPEEFFQRKAGVFVTIERFDRLTARNNGELRGCIGTYLPTKQNIAEEIIYNAIAAATEDWRFGPLQKEELPYLSYTVYILSEPEQIKDLKELDPKKYGIIIRTFAGEKTGLLLPDLEGIDTIEKQISITCQKGGIDPKEKILIYKFTAEKFKNDEK